MESFRRGAGLLVGLAALVLIPLDTSGQFIAHVHGSRVSVRSEASPIAPIAPALENARALNATVELAGSSALESHETAERSERNAYSHHGQSASAAAIMNATMAPMITAVCRPHPRMRAIMTARGNTEA